MQVQELEPEGEQQKRGRTPLAGKAQARPLDVPNVLGGERPWSGARLMLVRMCRRWGCAGQPAFFLPLEAGAALARQV